MESDGKGVMNKKCYKLINQVKSIFNCLKQFKTILTSGDLEKVNLSKHSSQHYLQMEGDFSFRQT